VQRTKETYKNQQLNLIAQNVCDWNFKALNTDRGKFKFGNCYVMLLNNL
jgi:hypothetical protein